jgi:hypothetical protein
MRDLTLKTLALKQHLGKAGKTSRSVTHPEIAPGQARLTPGIFAGGLPEKRYTLVV